MRRGILAALLILSVFASPALAQSAGGPEIGTRTAELAVETPHDTGDVSRSSANGTRLYSASSGPLKLHPQNFAIDDVVDFGVDRSGNASLSYQADFGQYLFEADVGGTYEIYWIASERVEVANETSNSTETELVQVRYEALVRVDDSEAVTLRPDEVESLRADAEEWRQFNTSVLDPLMGYESWYAPEPQDRDELISKMDRSYRTNHDFTRRLSGNLSEILILIVFSLGGWLFLAILALWHVGVVSSLWSRLNRFRANEATEGELSERIERLDAKERKFALENTDIQEIEGISDREAAAFRDAIDGVSVRDAKEHLDSTVLNSAALVLDRLRAMGAVGYGAHLVEDGYEDGDSWDVEILEPEDVPDDLDSVDDLEDLEEAESSEVLVDLESMSPELGTYLLENMEDWSPDPVRDFDLIEADFDPSDMEYPLDTIDVEELMDRIGVSEDRIGSTEAFGELLRDLVGHVRAHPYTESDGSTNPTRATLERLLKLEGVLADKHNDPNAQWQREAIERGLLEHDSGERTAQTVRDIKSGRGVSSD